MILRGAYGRTYKNFQMMFMDFQRGKDFYALDYNRTGYTSIREIPVGTTIEFRYGMHLENLKMYTLKAEDIPSNEPEQVF